MVVDLLVVVKLIQASRGFLPQLNHIT